MEGAFVTWSLHKCLGYGSQWEACVEFWNLTDMPIIIPAGSST